MQDSRMNPQGSGGLKSHYIDGEILVFTTKDGTEIYRVDVPNKKITYASGATVDFASGASLQSASVEVLADAGLAASATYAKTDSGTKTLLAAHATKDRGVLVVVEVTEIFATGTGTQPTLKIGETSTVEKCVAAATMVDKAVGTYCYGFTNTATKAILATLTAAVGNATGAAKISIIALPNS